MATLIDRERLKEMVDGGAQLIEVLPPKEYAEDHLPGAVSHPLRQLDKESAEIDRNRPIIVYCWDAA
ncbi:MAG: rhodanese-like domain-containing protein [Candidatus Dormiibacterota bacterium]|jgi:rhodanese-related sulfurtransferase